jgi:hypothetical protein
VVKKKENAKSSLAILSTSARREERKPRKPLAKSFSSINFIAKKTLILSIIILLYICQVVCLFV